MSDEIVEVLSRSDTVDVFSNPLVALWMREKAKRDPVAFCRLVQDNAERYSRLLGKPEKMRWGQEMYSIWEVEDLGALFLILAGERGSVFLLSYPGGERAFANDRKMGSAITALLERMLIDLSGFGSGNRG